MNKENIKKILVMLFVLMTIMSSVGLSIWVLWMFFTQGAA